MRDAASGVQRPEKELKAFAKVALQPGERKTVTLLLNRESLANFDDRSHEWVAEAGTFEVLIGASSRDIRAAATFELTETALAGVANERAYWAGRDQRPADPPPDLSSGDELRCRLYHDRLCNDHCSGSASARETQ